MSVTAVDLFAGAGGLSTGLIAAGATVDLAVEMRADAATTYSLNHADVEVVNDAIEPGWECPITSSPDLLAGGPPCQGWSTLGHRGSRARRRSQNAAIALFLEQVGAIQPRAVLLENVRGLALADRGARLDHLETTLDALGYAVTTRLLRASEYGVPQLRHRLFVIGIRKELGFRYQFPAPLASQPLTVADAIDDLPPLRPGGSSTRYSHPPRNPFQERMRTGVQELSWHAAPSHPPHLLELLSALPREGGSVRDLPAELRPTSGFHNTYARLRSDAPAPAVTSSIGRVSSGRHVHPRQNRALSVREAARLQTFPDDYLWSGKRWAVYEQVGNAVPPTLAAHIAGSLVAALEARPTRQAA